MATLATIAFYLGVIAYSAASTLFFLDLLRPGGEAARQWAPRILLVGALLHATHVVTGSLLSRVCPVESLHFGLSFSALCAASVYLVVYRRANLFATGAIVAPVALTFLVGAQFVGNDPGPEGISRPLLAFHITANVLGVGLFVVAGASGLLYLLIERRLKSKKLVGGNARLPSLEVLDRWTHRLLVAGFPLLSFGVVTGAVFTRELSGLGNAALARSLLGYATWLVLAVVLMARRVAGVRGRRAAYGTLAGVVCVLLVVLVYALRREPRLVITIVGVSHKSAPIAVRERFALPKDRVKEFLLELVGRPEVGEALMVSTCNRVEIVAAARGGSELERVASSCRSALRGLAPGAPEDGLYALTGGEAVRHLFQVSSSLDSLVLGEPQILGQVKDAYELARGAGTVGAVLHRALSRAIHAAKLVRSQTSVGSGQVSVPTVAADLARRIFGELRGHSVLLIGSGEMAETVARLLTAAGARLLVIGRTPEKVKALAEAVGGEARDWATLAASLPEVDIVISSTSAPGFVIERDAVSRARKSRRGRSQFYIDLAVPRDIDPSIEDLDGVFLYNIDDFSRVVSESLASRWREAERAREIIDAEAKSFDRWVDGEQATPTIVALRARIRGSLRTELDRTLGGRLRHLSGPDRAALETMLEASVNRLLHLPTTRLRQAASLESLDAPSFPELATAVDTLFALTEGASEGELASEPSTPPAASPEADADTEEAAPESRGVKKQLG